jgi:hypothetical protein
MSKTRAEITRERAAILGRAVYLQGGQRGTAMVLDVTPQTVGRWVKMRGPIPESVILWARSVIQEEDDIVKRAMRQGD